MSQETSFNLVDEPWVRIRDEEGNLREVSLMELFEQAPRIKCLANDLPTQDFAILRVLLAILQRSISPTLDDDDDPVEVWEGLWSDPELPVAAIHDYLEERRDCFDLFDAVTPFMQVAGLQTTKGDVSEAKKIVADVPDGDALFSLRSGKGVETLTYSEAARWLIHVHAFDTAGIKSGTVGDPRVKGGKSYPIGTGWAGGLGGLFFEGATLRETLLLNFIAREADDDELFAEDDLPAWERSVEPVGRDDRFPTGKLDLYTWQSRRVRLVPEDGKVVGVVLTNGDKLESRDKRQQEPMTAWKRSPTQEKKLKLPSVYLPCAHRSDKALWRGLDTLFGEAPGADNNSVEKSDLTKWLSCLVGAKGGRLLAREYLLKAHAVGFEYGTQSSVVTNVIDEKLDLNAFLLSDEGQDMVALAKECAASTSDAVYALGDFAGNLCLASGGSGADEVGGAKQAARKQVFFEIDSLFRLWLANLDQDSDAGVERGRWRRAARSAIESQAAILMSGLGPDAIVGAPVRGRAGKKTEWMTASRAEVIFNYRLKEALPLEGEMETKKEAR